MRWWCRSVGTSNVQQIFPFAAWSVRLTIPCSPMPESLAPRCGCIGVASANAAAAAAITIERMSFLLVE